MEHPGISQQIYRCLEARHTGGIFKHTGRVTNVCPDKRRAKSWGRSICQAKTAILHSSLGGFPSPSRILETPLGLPAGYYIHTAFGQRLLGKSSCGMLQGKGCVSCLTLTRWQLLLKELSSLSTAAVTGRQRSLPEVIRSPGVQTRLLMLF